MSKLLVVVKSATESLDVTHRELVVHERKLFVDYLSKKWDG